MRSILPVTALVLGFFSIPSTLAGPACSRRRQKQANCVAECSAKWGWPGSVMGTDSWGNVMSPSESKSISAIIASACGSDPSTATAGALGSNNPSSSSSTLNFVTAAASSSSSSTRSSSSTSTKVTSTTTVVATSTTTSKSSSKVSSSSSTSSTVKTSTISSTVKPTTVSSSSTSSSKTTTTVPPKATSTSSASTSTTATTSGTSSSDISQYLQFHNTVRAQHGASALTWNNTLASAAQSWANRCVFQHSGGSLGPFGENLAAGTGSGYGIQQAIQSWTNEASQYDPNNPQPSHFTQVVWKATTQVGCAVASCNGIFPASFGPAKYFVCEYFKQGNVIGQFPQNVQA